MRVTSHVKDLPERAHDAECGCGEHHSHVRVQLAQTFIGLVFIINSFVTAWLPVFDTNVVGFSAVTGALILGLPIIWLAVKDLRAGSFNTNLLVALAVLALFGGGHYQEAGIVSFFMQVGQIGRAQWLRDNGVDGGFMNSVDLNEAEGWSLIFVGRDKQCLGWVGLQDQTRAEAKESLAELKQAGVRRVAMVSGDRQPVAGRVAREIGCDEVVGDCLPQNKVEFVRQTRAKGYRVAVVGDGVNDAPALAAGDLGIAMGAAGSEVAIHSATIALMNNDLRRLPFLLRLARETRRVINQNVMLGICFVVGGLVLAAMKLINPVLAAMLHVAGSLLVVFNSFRLVRQGEELEPPLTAGATTPVAGTAVPESFRHAVCT